MPGWKVAFCVSLGLFLASVNDCRAAESVKSPQTINDLPASQSQQALWKKINDTTEANVQDILAVPSDIADLAQFKGRDFGYSPNSHTRSASSHSSKLKVPAERLTYDPSGQLVPSAGDRDLELEKPLSAPRQSVAGKVGKQHI